MTKRDISTVRIVPVKFGSILVYKWSVEKFNLSKRFDSSWIKYFSHLSIARVFNVYAYTHCFLDRICGMVDVNNYIIRVVNVLTFIYLMFMLTCTYAYFRRSLLTM